MKVKGKSTIPLQRGGMLKIRMPSFKLCAVVMLLLFTAVTACGCVHADSGISTATPSPAALGELNFGFTPRPLTTSGMRTPLTISQREDEVNGGLMHYPYVCDKGMELLNIAVRAACLDFAEEYGGTTGYRLRYNNRGLLSFTLYSVDGNGDVAAVSSANFDCDTGNRFYISSCFGKGLEDYRFALADSITEKLSAKGLTPLSYLPPVDDSRLFYIDEGGLVLLYRKYEVCGAEAGFPEVRFRFSELTRYIGQDSILLRMPYFEG